MCRRNRWSCRYSSTDPVVAFDKNSNNYLIPGTYVGNYDPVVSLNQTISATTTGVVIHPPSNPITFAATNYKSKVTPQTPGSSASSWNSFFLPEGWYALINPGQAIWGSVPDRSQLLDANLPIQQFAAGEQKQPRCLGIWSGMLGLHIQRFAIPSVHRMVTAQSPAVPTAIPPLVSVKRDGPARHATSVPQDTPTGHAHVSVAYRLC